MSLMTSSHRKPPITHGFQTLPSSVSRSSQQRYKHHATLNLDLLGLTVIPSHNVADSPAVNTQQCLCTFLLKRISQLSLRGCCLAKPLHHGKLPSTITLLPLHPNHHVPIHCYFAPRTSHAPPSIHHPCCQLHLRAANHHVFTSSRHFSEGIQNPPHCHLLAATMHCVACLHVSTLHHHQTSPMYLHDAPMVPKDFQIANNHLLWL